MSRKSKSGERGFTLLEIIVVLAVIAALAALLTPVVFRFIDDAKKSQAAGDVRQIAVAVNNLFKDTGRWPFCNNCTGAIALQAADAVVLTSNDACTGASAWPACDTTAPAVGTGVTGWASGNGDSLSDQLVKNTPFAGAATAGTAYATTGPRAWKGPYLERIPSVDPWNRSYLVNIGNADPAKQSSDTTTSGLKWTIAISAGPNGILDTNGDTFAVNNPQTGGDDIVARVK